MQKQIKLSLNWIGIVVFFTACGPMNTKPDETKSLAQKKQSHLLMSQDSSVIPNYSFSDQQNFLINIEAETGSEVRPKIGDNAAGEYNRYTFHVTRRVGNEPLQNAHVSVMYFNQKSKTQRKFNAPVTALPDGRYEVVFTFKRRGTWELHFSVKDGDLKDEFTDILDLNSTSE